MNSTFGGTDIIFRDDWAQNDFSILDIRAPRSNVSNPSLACENDELPNVKTDAGIVIARSEQSWKPDMAIVCTSEMGSNVIVLWSDLSGQ
jgi:hypothetical protein